MRIIELRQIGSEPFNPRRDTITNARVAVCAEIVEAAQAAARGIEAGFIATEEIEIAQSVLTVPRLRLSNSYRCYAHIAPGTVEVARFGRLHKFAVDKQSNLYYRHFYRDAKFRNDVWLWRRLTDLEKCWFQDDVLRGYLLNDLRNLVSVNYR